MKADQDSTPDRCMDISTNVWNTVLIAMPLESASIGKRDSREQALERLA